MLLASATEEPPYFCTIRATGSSFAGSGQVRASVRACPPGGHRVSDAGSPPLMVKRLGASRRGARATTLPGAASDRRGHRARDREDPPCASALHSPLSSSPC